MIYPLKFSNVGNASQDLNESVIEISCGRKHRLLFFYEIGFVLQKDKTFLHR